VVSRDHSQFQGLIVFGEKGVGAMVRKAKGTSYLTLGTDHKKQLQRNCSANRPYVIKLCKCGRVTCLQLLKQFDHVQ